MIASLGFRWKGVLLAVLAVAMFFVLRRGSYSYDECILDHMKSGMNEWAAGAVMNACRTYDRAPRPVSASAISAVPVEDLEDRGLDELGSSLTVDGGIATMEVTNNGRREIVELRVRRTIAVAGRFAWQSFHVHLQPGATTKLVLGTADSKSDPKRWEIFQASAVVAR